MSTKAYRAILLATFLLVISVMIVLASINEPWILFIGIAFFTLWLLAVNIKIYGWRG